MDSYKFPTLEAFESMVEDDCKKSFPKTWERCLKDYVKTDEAHERITEGYNEAKELYNAGKLPLKNLDIGEVSSVSYCLYMMC